MSTCSGELARPHRGALLPLRSPVPPPLVSRPSSPPPLPGVLLVGTPIALASPLTALGCHPRGGHRVRSGTLDTTLAWFHFPSSPAQPSPALGLSPDAAYHRDYRDVPLQEQGPSQAERSGHGIIVSAGRLHVHVCVSNKEREDNGGERDHHHVSGRRAGLGCTYRPCAEAGGGGERGREKVKVTPADSTKDEAPAPGGGQCSR